MFRFLGILVILIASVWIGVKISEDPGYALFTYKQWSMEMPLWFAIVGFALTLLVVYLILQLFDSIDFSLYRWKNWLRLRRKARAFNKTNRGLMELIEGNWHSSEQYLLSGIDSSSDPLINYLAAAKAAHEEKAFERRDAYLRKAYSLAPEAEIAIGITQAKLQMDQGQLEQALATLNHLYSLAPKHTQVVKLLERVYVHLGDWNALLNLLPSLRKSKVMNQENADKLEEKVYQELLINSAAKAYGSHPIVEAWQSIPKKFKTSQALVLTYAKLLAPYPETAEGVEELINKIIKRTWDPELVKVYGILKTSDVKTQLTRAENWKRTYGNQAALLLTLARLCMRAQLWGKARDYFQESLRLENVAETSAEYGKLLEQLSETESALQIYKDGLKLASVSDTKKSNALLD